jgi:hypothetical protein
VKELHLPLHINRESWSEWVRWAKIGLLIVSVVLSAWGAWRFLDGLWALFD